MQPPPSASKRDDPRMFMAIPTIIAGVQDGSISGSARHQRRAARWPDSRLTRRGGTHARRTPPAGPGGDKVQLQRRCNVVQHRLWDSPPPKMAPKAPELTRSKKSGPLLERRRASAFHPIEGTPTDAAQIQAFFAFGLALGLLVWPAHAMLRTRPACVPSPG